MLSQGCGTLMVVARNLPKPLQFENVWVVGPVTEEYVYAVTHLDLAEGHAPTLLVRIGKDFDAWEVSRHQ